MYVSVIDIFLSDPLHVIVQYSDGCSEDCGDSVPRHRTEGVAATPFVTFLLPIYGRILRNQEVYEQNVRKI